MSDKEALRIFSRQAVSQEMVGFLVSTTNSIIQVKSNKPQPRKYDKVGESGLLVSAVGSKPVSLTSFINRLIKYLNVQTPTLMTTLIFLNKLRNRLPANAVGMETTRHRIFLAALILSAKLLNDSSPLNKHWTKYTDGLLSIDEVNMAERELISLLKWNITIHEDELIMVLQPFLSTIKKLLDKKNQEESTRKANYYRLSNSYKIPSSRSNSSVSISSIHSNLSLQSANSSSYTISSLSELERGLPQEHYRAPLAKKLQSSLNIATHDLKQPRKTLYKNPNHSDINLINSGRILA